MNNVLWSNEGPQISADIINAQYTVETLVMAVLAGSIFSLLVGFFTGYFCGRRCHKDEDDNLPYPDTEYEYFEQRQNVNRSEERYTYIDSCTVLTKKYDFVSLVSPRPAAYSRSPSCCLRWRRLRMLNLYSCHSHRHRTRCTRQRIHCANLPCIRCIRDPTQRRSSSSSPMATIPSKHIADATTLARCDRIRWWWVPSFKTRDGLSILYTQYIMFSTY